MLLSATEKRKLNTGLFWITIVTTYIVSGHSNPCNWRYYIIHQRSADKNALRNVKIHTSNVILSPTSNIPRYRHAKQLGKLEKSELQGLASRLLWDMRVLVGSFLRKGIQSSLVNCCPVSSLLPSTVCMPFYPWACQCLGLWLRNKRNSVYLKRKENAMWRVKLYYEEL